jgi:hypothetical protein
VRSRLFSPSPTSKAASVAKRKQLLSRNSQRKRTYPNPQSSILWFLCHAKLSATTASLTLPVDFSTKYRTVGTSFHSNPDISHKPFNEMKSRLMTGSSALTHMHSRLILEDIISLHPGEEVVCLIHRDHPYFKMKQFVSKLKMNLEQNPIKPVIIKKKLFFAARLQIQRNPAGDEITSGMKTKVDLINCVTNEVYGAVQMEFSDVMNADDDTTDSDDSARDREEEINDSIEEDAAGKSQKEIYEEVVIEINVAKKRGQNKDKMRKNQLTGIY